MFAGDFTFIRRKARVKQQKLKPDLLPSNVSLISERNKKSRRIERGGRKLEHETYDRKLAGQNSGRKSWSCYLVMKKGIL